MAEISRILLKRVEEGAEEYDEKSSSDDDSADSVNVCCGGRGSRISRSV